MYTYYAKLDLPFSKALSVLATVVSVSAKGWIIADAGLKPIHATVSANVERLGKL